MAEKFFKRRGKKPVPASVILEQKAEKEETVKKQKTTPTATEQKTKQKTAVDGGEK